MPKFGLRKTSSSSFYSTNSEEEMNPIQNNPVDQLRMEASQACSNLAEGVQQLRNETSQVCSDIVTGVSEGFVSKEDLHNYHQEVMKQFAAYDRVNNEILSSLDSIKKATLFLNQQRKGKAPADASASTSTPPIGNIFIPQPPVDDNASTTTRYDSDHDVIMRSAFPYTVAQVPEPGLFSGDISETELFCQLCADTFKTYPCKLWPEDSKINFVQSRLRGAARSWYQTKYPSGVLPVSLEVLLDELRRAFPDLISKKLKKISLVNLKHTYGKIKEYIDSFRKLTADLGWPEEPLVLLFYNGLHPKFKEEINKMEIFPEKIEEIITKCILFESSQESKAKISQIAGSKSDKKKNPVSRPQNGERKENNYNPNNNSNKNNGFFKKSKYNGNNNNHNNNSHNNNNNHVTDVQKINTKN